MNLNKLRDAEALFLSQYPGGFENEEMQKVGKKHRVQQMTELAQQTLKRSAFKQTGPVLESITKLVSRSSMVSMFEKPKFRDYVDGLNRNDRAALAEGFRKLFHGNQEKGFNEVRDILLEGKLAKWSLMTICLFYLHPTDELFVKPNTTKDILRRFEIDDLVYKPLPTWAFYEQYRGLISKMKRAVDPSLAVNNAAFTGFLMITSAIE